MALMPSCLSVSALCCHAALPVTLPMTPCGWFVRYELLGDGG
jgi:hypothetical protein